MDTIDTMISNARILANADIDWSLDGGMIWLTGMAVICVTMLAVAITRE